MRGYGAVLRRARGAAGHLGRGGPPAPPGWSTRPTRSLASGPAASRCSPGRSTARAWRSRSMASGSGPNCRSTWAAWRLPWRS